MKDERVIGGLRCADVLEKLDAFVDGTLADDERRALTTHVAGCERCERFGGTYAEVVKRLRAAARPADPPPGVVARLMARLDGMEKPR